ncbi:MAG: hypothetical protein ACFFCH_10580 [Promethearchaeota archaeon]
MNELAFRTYLFEQKVDRDQSTSFITKLEAMRTHFKPRALETLPRGAILQYTEHLVTVDADAVLDTLRALIHYGNFIENYNYVAEVLDIAEAYNAMETLYSRVGEQCGTDVRDAIFADLELPPLGVDPESKSEFTKVVMRRLEAQIGEAKTVELLAPCLHGRPEEPKAREDFLRLNDIDEFLALKHKEVLDRFRQHKKDGTLEWAQYVDDEGIAYVENTLTISPGIREGDKIIQTKIPYQIKAMLDTQDSRMKRYYVCYCPWVRGAIKDGTEKEISPNFCHCSAGFTKKYWDYVFGQPVSVQPVETALTGAFHCKFAIQIPKEYQK